MTGSVTPVEEGVPYGTRLGQVAESGGDDTAVVFVAEDGGEQTITWRQLERRSNQLARVLADRGLGVGEPLAVCLRNSLEHLLAGFAGWKVGATVVPVRWDLPQWERDRLLAVLSPTVVLDADGLDLIESSRSASDAPLPEVVSPHGWGVCSSGSTGTPKVIVQKNPAYYMASTSFTSTVVASFGPMSPSQLVLCPAPIYHTNGFTAFRTLLNGDPIVLMERFPPRWRWISSSVTGSPVSSPPPPCCSGWPRFRASRNATSPA